MRGCPMNAEKVDDAVADYKKLTKKQRDVLVREIKDAIKQANSDGKNSLLSYVKLSVSLINARNSLKKEFYDVINDDIIKKKQNQRLVALTIDSKSKKDFRDQTNKDLNIDEKIVKLLEKDDPFKDLKFPSQSKLQKCLSMTSDDFDAVMAGNDEPYNNVKDPRPVVPPEGMTLEQYNTYKKRGTKKLIEDLFNSEKEKETLNNKISSLQKETNQNNLTLTGQDKEISKLEADISTLKKQIRDLQVENENQKEPVAA